MRRLGARGVGAVGICTAIIACSSSSNNSNSNNSNSPGGGTHGADLPRIEPPVAASLPPSLGGTAMHPKAGVLRVERDIPFGPGDDAGEGGSADVGDVGDGGGILPDGGTMGPGGGGGILPDGGTMGPGGGGGILPDGGTMGPGGGGGILPDGGTMGPGDGGGGGTTGPGDGGSVLPDGGIVSTAFSVSDLQSRFFMGGPTDVFGILDAVDTIIGQINAASSTSTSACLTQAPVAYALTQFAAGTTFYAQCYLDSPTPGFTQFGTHNGSIYVYMTQGSGGPEQVAAIVTPIAGTANADGGAPLYAVQAWVGIGYSNAGLSAACPAGGIVAFDDCSYGVIAITANEATSSFELAAAGLGFGVCGAQLKSDGTNIYAVGSNDMGTCGAAQTVCASAADLTTPGTCSGSLTSLAITPLGREQTTGPNAAGPGNPPNPSAFYSASAYPGDAADTILLNGTTSDSLHFGPLAPTPGVGLLVAGPASGLPPPGGGNDAASAGDGG